MRYSLLSRFQGALVGTVAGSYLGNNYQIISASTQTNLSKTESKTDDAQTHPKSWYGLSEAVKLAVICSEGLSNCQGWNTAYWQSLTRQTATQELINQALSLSPENVVIATLPLTLFYYENLPKMQHYHQEMINVWQLEQKYLKIVLTVGYIIAQALRDKLKPTNLIDQTINYLGEVKVNNLGESGEKPALETQAMINQLKLVQSLIRDKSCLEIAVKELKKNANSLTFSSDPEALPFSIVLALYCFLSTPTDWHLIVQRASQSHDQPQITGAIGGLLGGTYNSIINIPLKWKISIGADGRNNCQEIKDLATNLFNAWLGIIVSPSIQRNIVNSVIPVATSDKIRHYF